MKNKATPRRRLISVALPVYDMGGHGATFLKFSLDILGKQTFKDFDIVVSDYSKTDTIKKLCHEYRHELPIRYHKNTDPTGGMSANVNNAIRQSTGRIIKILFQDDFLYNEQSLQIIADNFDLKKDRWLVTGCEHTRDGVHFIRPFFPRWNPRIIYGKNTLGAPTVLAIKNDNPLLFDTKMKWLTDCDYYTRCYEAYGPPKIVPQITAVIRTGDHQITNTEATNAIRQAEYEYVLDKHGLIDVSESWFTRTLERIQTQVRVRLAKTK